MSHENYKIAVLGLTGRTGMQLGKQLLEKGYHIKALVRNESKIQIKHSNLEIQQASMFDENNLRLLIKDTSAIISVLGYTKNSPPFFQTEIIKKLIPLMEEKNCKRIILLTGSGVPFENDENTFGNKVLSKMIYLLARTRFLDGVYQLDELKKSSLLWTVLRCPLLLNSPEVEKNVYIGNKAPGFFNTINRSTVASLIINELESKDHIRRALFAWR